jgi:hypothetical protein
LKSTRVHRRGSAQFCRIAAFAVTYGLLLVGSARAAVTSPINSPAGSYASITFDDTASLNPSFIPGTTLLNQNVSPWGGVPPINNTLSSTTDPVTFDVAQGDIVADVIGGNYSISLNNISLSQAPGNTGLAHLLYQFSVEFQLDGAGLPSQATVFPNFAVNGTVQSGSGSYAAVKGYINYDAVNTAGVINRAAVCSERDIWKLARHPGPGFSCQKDHVPKRRWKLVFQFRGVNDSNVKVGQSSNPSALAKSPLFRFSVPG